MSHGFDNSRFDHEPLCLRVFFPQGPRTFELRDGLSIGSDVDCDVFIHHIDVEPHHAQISRSAGRTMRRSGCAGCRSAATAG